MMAIMFFATYFTTTFSEGATTTNCLLISGWAALQMVFNLMNFVFCLWLFKELRQQEQEREYSFRRQMNEYYQFYQVCT